jgi:uncharacterized protein YktB (UPF0637 family)
MIAEAAVQTGDSISHFGVGLMALTFLIWLAISLSNKNHESCKACKPDEVEEAIMKQMATQFIEECKNHKINPEKIFHSALDDELKQCTVIVQSKQEEQDNV